jgi:membrane protease subunit HflC
VRRLFTWLLVLALVFVGLVAAGNLGFGPLVITREDEQKLVLLFGEVRGVTEPGLSLRLPFFHDIQTYDARWLYLNTEPLPIQTRDGEELNVDNYVIWRISDPIEFRRKFPARMTQARDRIDKTVRDYVREVIGRHTLIEVLDDQRDEIMREITGNSRSDLDSDGIEVADVRINRTELPAGAESSVYERMKAERGRLARKNRAEGEERARRIRAEADREARVIVANANRDASITRGEGEAEASRIYAEAYGQAPEFYAFLRSLEAYRKTVGDKTTLVLSPDSEFFRYLQGSVVEPPRN